MRPILVGARLALTMSLATALAPLAVSWLRGTRPAGPVPVPQPGRTCRSVDRSVDVVGRGRPAARDRRQRRAHVHARRGRHRRGIVELEVLEATRGWSSSVPPPEGMAAWTFLVRFSWDGREPTGFGTGQPYYNAIGFTMRDDEGFEYPNLQSDLIGRQPALLSGTLAEGQSVQGWLTFHAAADAPYVELTYDPISDERVFFKAMAP